MDRQLAIIVEIILSIGMIIYLVAACAYNTGIHKMDKSEGKGKEERLYRIGDTLGGVSVFALCMLAVSLAYTGGI